MTRPKAEPAAAGLQTAPLDDRPPAPAAGLVEALARAQLEFGPIEKSRTARIWSERRKMEFSYSYADLSDVLAVVRPVLARHGLALVQRTAVAEQRMVLVTEILHPSGERIEAVIPLPPTGDPQAFGTLLSYLRRYALCAIAGVQAEEDLDGQLDTAPTTPASGAVLPPPLPAATEAAPARARWTYTGLDGAAVELDAAMWLETFERESTIAAEAVEVADLYRQNRAVAREIVDAGEAEGAALKALMSRLGAQLKSAGLL